MTVKTPPLRATRVDSLLDAVAPGSFKFYSGAGADGLNFKCPCGCGALFEVRFASNAWSYDGNRDDPTISPSVSCSVTNEDGDLVEHWHGWLRTGVWTSA